MIFPVLNLHLVRGFSTAILPEGMLEGNRERSKYSIRKIMDEGKQFMWIPATFRTSSHQQQQVYHRYISPRIVYVYTLCIHMFAGTKMGKQTVP